MGKIVDVVNKDPFIWYVIDAEGNKRAVMGVRFVNDYATLNAQCKGEPGIFFVRNAAATETNTGGDPSVHEGWACYVWDNELTATTAGFRKIAEQESVDGPWGIDERILKMLVKKSDFDSTVSGIRETLSQHTQAIQQTEQNVTGMSNSINELNSVKHAHTNKNLLDKLSFSNGRLLIDGQVPAGSGYRYDNIVDGEIVWKDPADPESEAVVVPSSAELAAKFVTSVIAAEGMQLEVVLQDGSVSTFNIIKADDGDLYPLYSGNKFETTVVSALPTPAIGLGRGIFIPTTDDGTHPAFHYYKVVDGAWVDVTDLDKGKVLAFDGAWFSAVRMDLDPLNPVVKNILTVNLPVMQKTDSTTGRVYKHEKTYLVRKFGKLPTSIEDGRIIGEFTSNPTEPIEDVVSIYRERAFYKLFSYTTSGAMYTTSSLSEAEPKALTWQDITTMRIANVAKHIQVGDTIYLPPHPEFGDIGCEVISIDSSAGMKLASKDVLTVMKFGATNVYADSNVKTWVEKMFLEYSKYKGSNDSAAEMDKNYFTYNKNTHEFEVLEVSPGAVLPRGVELYEINGDIPHGVIDAVTIPSASMSNISQIKNLPKAKLSTGTEWWMQDTSGSNITTSKQPTGIAPTEEAGVVVVFSIKHG